MARNTITVTFTADSIVERYNVENALADAAQAYGTQAAQIRDITVVSVEPVEDEVTVPPAILAAFRAWQAQQANV